VTGNRKGKFWEERKIGDFPSIHSYKKKTMLEEEKEEEETANIEC
jgi:hypothetical protein